MTAMLDVAFSECIFLFVFLFFHPPRHLRNRSRYLHESKSDILSLTLGQNQHVQKIGHDLDLDLILEKLLKMAISWHLVILMLSLA